MPLMNKEDIDALQPMLQKARQKPLPFGICLGKKPENNLLLIDRQKSPDFLERRAKKEGETNKAVGGMLEMDSKTVVMTLEGDALPNMARSMKNFFQKTGLKYKVRVTDADGTVLDSAEEDEDGNVDAATSETSNQEAPQSTDDQQSDPMAGKWQAAKAAFDPLVTKFSTSGDERAPAIVKAWAGAEAAAGKGDFKSALTVAAKIKPILTAVQAPEETVGQDVAPDMPSPEEERWAQESGPLAEAFEAAMAKNPKDRSKLEAAYAMAVEKAEVGEFKAALVIAGKLKPRLDKIAEQQESDTANEIPKGTVDYQKSRLLWNKTRSKMSAELTLLQKEIEKVAAGIPELAAVSNEFTKLHTHMEGFDEQLEDVLDELSQSPDGDRREKLKGMAKQKITQYQQLLEQDFFKDVDSNNGFRPVSVRSSAISALGAISKSLAA